MKRFDPTRPADVPGSRVPEILERLLRDRIVFIGTPIDDWVAQFTVDGLLSLAKRDARLPLNVYINSPGGSVTATLTILRAMADLRMTVRTWCLGSAKGSAVNLLAQGTRGFRSALPASAIQFSSIWGGGPAAAESISKHANEIAGHLALTTGRSPAELLRDLRAERTFSAREALEYGIIDAVVETLPGGA